MSPWTTYEVWIRRQGAASKLLRVHNMGRGGARGGERSSHVRCLRLGVERAYPYMRHLRRARVPGAGTSREPDPTNGSAPPCSTPATNR